MTLKELNKAVCGLVKRAAEASGLGAELMAEDLSAPIQRPSLKVELEEDRDARPSGTGWSRPSPSGSISSRRTSTGPSWTTWLCARPWPRLSGRGPRGGGDGAHRRGAVLTVTDGVLVASMDLTLDQRIIPAEEEDAELMEELNVNLRCIDMAVTLPKIEVTFKQLAASFVRRLGAGDHGADPAGRHRGEGESFFRFGDATQVPENEFTAANQQYIKDALSFGPLRVSVVKVGAEGRWPRPWPFWCRRSRPGGSRSVTAPQATGPTW